MAPLLNVKLTLLYGEEDAGKKSGTIERLFTDIRTTKYAHLRGIEDGFNIAIDDCRTLLIEEARKITNNE